MGRGVNVERAEKLLAVYPPFGSPPITVKEAMERAGTGGHGYTATRELVKQGRVIKTGSGYTRAPETAAAVANGLPALPPPPEQQTVPQTIRIDPEVYRALQARAVPFETPNDVLRRLLGLGSRREQ
jgi:hypothetical protein